MKFFTLPALLAAALLSALAVVPFLPTTNLQASTFALEVRMKSSTAGIVQVFYDDGSGLSEAHSSRANLDRDVVTTCRLPLPNGHFRSLRFDPLDHDGTIEVESIRLVGAHGRVLRNFAFTEFQPANQIQSAREHDGHLELIVTPGGNDPQLTALFDPPLALESSLIDRATPWFVRSLAVFLAVAALLLLIERLPGLRATVAGFAASLRVRPGRAIAEVAALAVIVSAYPVVFLGQSFVSPNTGTQLLYETFPTLPGYTSTVTSDVKGSDIGAVMWQHIPLSMLQHRALSEGELPLWNRYNSAGTPLLGQGQSMFGDPVHLLVIAANGASWAWDAKYLIAKWLFAAALGLLVLAATRQLPAALIVSLAAPFAGFFIYRFNHPAFFSLCYSPWALYCWVRIAQARTTPVVAGWATGLILANTALMNSGTAKEAYVLLLMMNFSGACALLASGETWRRRLGKFAGLAWAGVTFTLLNAPVWLTFLHSLKNSYTSYNAPSAFQIQPALLLGLFDELFYRPLTPGNLVFDPSLNFLLLAGVLYFLATLRQQLAHPIVLALALSSLVPVAFAFGVLPPAWIASVPILGNVAHIDNSFSCVLIVLWSVVAGAGFAQAADRLGTRDGRGDLLVGGLVLLALVFAWIGFHQALHRSVFGIGLTLSAIKEGAPPHIDGFIWWCLAVEVSAIGVLALVARRALIRGVVTPAAALLAVLCIAAMVWREALHTPAVGYADYGLRPTTRVDFHAVSDAVEFVRTADRAAPSRTVGLRGNFFPGWTGTYGIETINGPDALMSPWLRELVGVSGVERIWDWRVYVDAPNLAASRPFLDFLNVRYYFGSTGDQAQLTPALRLVHRADLDVYESPTAWPRAFFADHIDVYDTAPELIAKIKAAGGRPFAAALRADYSSTSSLIALPRGFDDRRTTAATHYQLTENTTSFDLHADRPGVIVLTEVLWPGDFRAEVNGAKAPILRLNHAFKGVVVDAAGDYQVTFRYVPKGWPRNLLLCGVGGLLLAGSLLLIWRSGRTARLGSAGGVPALS